MKSDLDDLRERLMRRTERVDECLIWQGYEGKDGYGQIKYRGRVWKAHRASWLVHRGEIPDEYVVCHTCDERLCVNPLHLFPSTHEMNMKDMVLKGRSPDSRHEKNSQSKLTWEDVDLIRQADDAGYDHLDIACRFGVSRGYVGKIVREEVWREEDRV